MTRYIKNLHEMPLHALQELYEEGKKSIDVAFASGEDSSFITIAQMRFIADLIRRKGGSV